MLKNLKKLILLFIPFLLIATSTNIFVEATNDDDSIETIITEDNSDLDNIDETTDVAILQSENETTSSANVAIDVNQNTNNSVISSEEDSLTDDSNDQEVNEIESDESIKEEIETTVFSYEDDEITVSVEVEKTALPKNAELFVTKLDDEKVDSLKSEDTTDAVGYDIGFTNDGEEVEPTSEASVSISLKKEYLGSDVDVDSINIQHIKDDETSDTVADAKEGDTVKETDDVVETTFTTDSFSYFIIHYNNNYKIYAHLIDLDGTEFPASESDQLTITASYDQANFYAWNRKENVWVEIKTLVATYGEFTNGYVYQSTHLDSADGTEIKWIYYSTSRSGTRKANTWYYSTSDTRPTSTPTSSTPTIAANSSIYCAYRKDVESNSEIQDLYREQGVLYLPKPTGISDTAEVTYKWYRCSTKYGEYEYAKRTKITGGSYNIVTDDTGTKLYPALDVSITDEYLTDTSVRFWYKVEVYVNGELYETTASIQNQYYASLQDGSFEDVDTQVLNYGQQGSFIPEGTTGLQWKTTGSDHQLEIGYAPNSSAAYGLTSAPDGNQFAELNAEAAGALYQDIMSTPNTNLYWKLYHRARVGTDTMYLVVAPTHLVEDITTQSQLESLISAIQADPDTYEAQGFYLQTISDDTSGWGKYTGSYVVPEDDYLTRMFFVAGATGSGNTTTGNFIDAVAFTPFMPDADPDYGNITVVKEVTGITSEDISNYKLQVKITNTTTNTVVANETLDFSKATLSDDGAYDLTYSLYELDAGNKYKVEETVLTDLDSLNASYEVLGSTYTVDGGTETDYTTSGISFTLDEGTTKKVQLNNSYKPEAVKLNIDNSVVGNMGSKDKEFSYVVQITSNDGVTTESFTLKNNESKSLSIPYGAKIEIIQENYSDDGYNTYFTLDDDDTRNANYSFTIDNMKNDASIHYVNNRRSAVPTGKHDSNPIGILEVSILGIIGIILMRKLKNIKN